PTARAARHATRAVGRTAAKRRNASGCLLLRLGHARAADLGRQVIGRQVELDRLLVLLPLGDLHVLGDARRRRRRRHVPLRGVAARGGQLAGLRVGRRPLVHRQEGVLALAARVDRAAAPELVAVGAVVVVVIGRRRVVDAVVGAVAVVVAVRLVVV